MPPIRKKYSRNDKAGISRGKLVDKFRNALKFIRSAEKLKNNNNYIEQNVVAGSQGINIFCIKINDNGNFKTIYIYITVLNCSKLLNAYFFNTSQLIIKKLQNKIEFG